ncbi:MAG: hypothetical protein EBZ45_04680, partial [Actinobacteria bacterium]|nr:hypothetical protein [Actinomycetota bacterium]
MNAPLIALSRRLRNTPFTSRIERFGVQAYTVYNHMLLPSRFRGLEEDYWHLRNAVQIECGYYHSLAVLVDGRVKQWGDLIGGASAPWPFLREIVQVSGGGYHAMALRSNGAVACWGANGAGQIMVPSSVVGAVQISAGYYHSAALLSTGSVVCWGAGVGKNDYDLGQTSVPASLAGATKIA